MALGSKPLRVLIVDDEPVITDSLVIIFSNAGYQARGVYSAEEARSVLNAFSPDLAVLDVRLPHMNGVDLAILLRAAYPLCRLILFSGQIDSGSILDAALGQGHTFDIFAKPVHPLELLSWAAIPGPPN